jgi:predicted nucleotidyltransferase
MIRLPTEFKEFLQLLHSEEVEYLLVGGYAVGFHGYPRATGDIDIWINPGAENSARVVRALLGFGFSSQTLNAGMFQQPEKVFRIGVPPLRIDLLTGISGRVFEACFADRVAATIDGVDVNVISLENLKANKQASGRLKDLSDLENLP